MTVREPEFAESDRLVLLASRWLDQQPRGRHGYLLSDATDPEKQHGWTPRKPRRDYAQAVINKKQDEYRKLYKDADFDSLLWGVEFED